MAYAGCEMRLDRVPVTILTGFLGSGKTTLLNHILSATHGKKIAIIENEFGEVAIDDALLKQDSKYASDEEIVEVLNGCICCTVRSDLIAILQKLADRHERGEIVLDAIVVETTGMADPTPVAQTFLIDEKIRGFARLDGIVTLVDTKHIEQHLDALKPQGAVNEAAAQVGFADRLLLNKMDLVTPADGERVEARLREINPYAPIQRCTRSEVSVESVLNIHGFDLDRTLAALPDFLNASAPPTKHDSSVKSVSLSQAAARHMRQVRDGDLDLNALQEWLRGLLDERGADIFRVKGVLSMAHSNSKFVCHAVHTIFTADFDEEWAPGEPRKSKLVFIGKGLDAAELAASFNSCLATPENYARRAASLRFAVGEHVEFCGGPDPDDWVNATVVSHWFRDDEEMPLGFVAPYEVQRHDEEEGYTTWADYDNDHFIRRLGTGAALAAAEAAEGTAAAGGASGTHANEKGAHEHAHDGHPAKVQKTS